MERIMVGFQVAYKPTSLNEKWFYLVVDVNMSRTKEKSERAWIFFFTSGTIGKASNLKCWISDNYIYWNISCVITSSASRGFSRSSALISISIEFQLSDLIRLVDELHRNIRGMPNAPHLVDENSRFHVGNFLSINENSNNSGHTEITFPFILLAYEDTWALAISTRFRL